MENLNVLVDKECNFSNHCLAAIGMGIYIRRLYHLVLSNRPPGVSFLKSPTHLHGREGIDTRYASITDCIEQFVAVNETLELTIEIFENDELVGKHKILYRFVQNGILEKQW